MQTHIIQVYFTSNIPQNLQNLLLQIPFYV